MFTQIKIANYKADAYLNKPTCTIDIKDADFIQINGRVIKDELKDGEEYVTIKANDGGAFSPDWEKSDLKILFILRESYILKKSYYEYGDRGGHKQNEEYDDNNELWGNSTYRNVVKICYFIYHSKLGIPLKEVDFKQDEVWDEACDIFRKHAAVICANPFPGLAFCSIDTDPVLLAEWLKLPEVQELLKEKIGRLDPKYIYGAFDLGLVSSYSHLFGWLKGRTLNELVGIEGAQRIFDSEIVAGGVAAGRTYVVDKNGLVWIQGTHPSRISHKKTKEFASAIFHALRTL
ncbi:MAG: hypothetical protein J6Q39_05555 [Bacteroidales bacterium]|nr:hypothetical protein [Bacteroidales bacterium]